MFQAKKIKIDGIIGKWKDFLKIQWKNPIGSRALKEFYRNAGSALTVQFDEAKPEEGESLRKENNNG